MKIKAMILRGKDRGKIVEVLQWRNDWFHLDDKRRIYSPSALAFDSVDIATIQGHAQNGTLFEEYDVRMAPAWTGLYLYTFKKR